MPRNYRSAQLGRKRHFKSRSKETHAAAEPGDWRRSAIPSFVSALVSPVLIFYGAGYLLSFGYFFVLGPSLMTAFSPTELALAGFSRLTSTLTVILFVAFFLATVAYVAAARTTRLATKSVDWFAGGMCLIGALWIVLAIGQANFLGGLLCIVAVFMLGGFGIAFLLGQQDWFRKEGHPWR